MSKGPLTELMRVLHNTEFSVVPRGRHHCRDIYAMVQAAYPHLCDDKVKCECGGHPKNHPEWQHRVQAKLGYLKRKGRRISKPQELGYWEFS